MSSAVLYLAIVAVWGIVLVPMWLRRDGDGIGRLLHRRNETILAEHPDEAAPRPPVDGLVMVEESTEHNDREPLPTPTSASRESLAPIHRRRATRGAVIARRRRRTLGLSLLTLTAVVLTAVHVAPWWFVFPPTMLLAGHLSLLRVAVRMDHARRAEARRAQAIRAERLQRARDEREAWEVHAAEEVARTAEVIELPGRDEEVYDQYTDLRAVGD